MKTQSIIKTIVLSSAFALIITSCKKEPLTTNSTTDPATVAAIQGMRIAYTNAKTYNDSLNYWYSLDSTHYIGMMLYCDSLYHNCNTIMMNNYNTMNSGGGMMNGSTTGVGMMNGGSSNGGMMSGGTSNNNSSNGGMMSGGTNNGNMMNGNNGQLNCTINGNNCAVMITSLHQHHIHHPIH